MANIFLTQINCYNIETNNKAGDKGYNMGAFSTSFRIVQLIGFKSLLGVLLLVAPMLLLLYVGIGV